MICRAQCKTMEPREDGSSVLLVFATPRALINYFVNCISIYSYNVDVVISQLMKYCLSSDNLLTVK